VATHAHTARPATSGGWFAPDRRQAWTAASEPSTFRPATATARGFPARPGSALRPGTASGSGSSGFVNFEDMHGAEDTASSLTRGDTLAGAPVAVARQRRLQDAGDMLPGLSDLDIRELLRRYQTFAQPSCIPRHELASRRREAQQRRPSTRDVRIHTVPDAARPGSGDSGLGALSPGGGLSRSPAALAAAWGFGLSEPEGSAREGVDGETVLTALKDGAGEVLLLDLGLRP